MFDTFFRKYSDYEIVRKPSQEQIESYRGILPNSILTLWDSHGFGIFMDGYLRLIDPSLFQEFVDQNIESIGVRYTPWAINAYGDLFVYRTDDNIDFYNYRHAQYNVIGDGTDLYILFDHLFVDELYIWEELRCTNFPELKTKLGIPAYDQCYGYFPLVALGGSESVDHVQIVDLRVHMDLMAQAIGPL